MTAEPLLSHAQSLVVLASVAGEAATSRAAVLRTRHSRHSYQQMTNHTVLAAELEALHPRSFGWALACCDRRREEAEDVLHDSYDKVLDGRARFDGRSTFRTWFFSVVARTAAEHRRRTRLREILGLRHANRIDRPRPLLSPDEGAMDVDRAERIAAALARLSRRQREVLHLVFYQDLSLEEAAAVMDISVGSASTHYKRGKARMAQLLEDEHV